MWTLKRIAQLIQKDFDIRYHPNHLWRLLRGLGWSCQKPERRALERNEAEIAHWKRYHWPHIKKRARGGAHLVFLDESGFLLIPNLTRTWAPRGQTPILYHRYQHDRISAISALWVSPQRRRVALYLQFRRRNFDGLDVRAFLQHLLRHLRGPLVLLWDRGSIHQRKEVAHSRQRHQRLQVEEFPAYAPELNPAEYVWNQTDHLLLNCAPENVDELHGLLRKSVRHLRTSQKLLWACVYASDLPWTR